MRCFHCTLNNGRPFVACVPPKALREILNELVDIIAEFNEKAGARER